MLIDKYNELYQKVKCLNDNIAEAEASLQGTGGRRNAEIQARIDNLEEQLKKIDEYTLKIEAFRQIAENHIESLNLLTVETPVGYRVNLNRLRNWAMMIDPMSNNDPYAQRVYLTAKCDEHFLSIKRQEFSMRIESLKSNAVLSISAEADEKRATIAHIHTQLSELASSSEVIDFSRLVEDANDRYRFDIVPEKYRNAAEATESVALGAYAVPLGFPEDYREQIQRMFGKNYDEKSGQVLLPAEMPTSKEFFILIKCAPPRIKRLDRGLQNLIMNIVEGNPAGNNKVYVIDAVRFSSAMLGSLKQLEESFAIERLPRNPDQVSTLLERIVSGFADMDDLLGLFDSVIEYNAETDAAKRIARSTLILFGWPNAFEGHDREHIQRIITNHERYGVSIIIISFSMDEKKDDSNKALPDYIAHNATYITMKQKETTILSSSETLQGFTWYVFSNELPESYAESVKEIKIETTTKGSIYADRYELSGLPEYERIYKKLELPYGVDAKDNTHSMSFENENFAAYLVGASGSGKSTLLHTLIAGIIRNFHPDNVELWLADFKQLEFKKYMKHCPPHIRYILLDESVEIVYDLVDRINEKMMERQRKFARLGIERLNQVDPRSLDEPMPIIFIILDEFSVMSQAVSESSVYKLRLQNVLAKGRALGIRFLFSSQTFTKGIAGLTPTAKDQIQQRISMKGTREEISETLELSTNLKTDQVRNWIDALPPFYALVKHRTGADTPPEVARVKVLWFPDYDMRDDMIDRINSSMTAVEHYNPNDISSYVGKKPVTVDGNTFDAFDARDFLKHIKKLKDAGNEYSSDDVFASFGTPRLMEKIKASVLTPETRENILLIGRDAEQSCTAAILTSAMKSFLVQGHNVQIWAYGKNRLYAAYQENPWHTEELSGIRFVEGMDNVCDAIQALRERIKHRDTSTELIVLVGMDRICSDFEFIDGGADSITPDEEVHEKRAVTREKEAILSGAVAETKYDKAFDEWSKKQFAAWSKAKKEATVSGMSREEAKIAGEKANKDFAERNPPPKKEDFANVSIERLPEYGQNNSEFRRDTKAVRGVGAYNAMEDFQYVVKQGSKLGYHFMLCLNSLADIKALALKVDLFRHRLSFQVSVDDSREIFGNRNASALPERICQYYDTLEGYSFRPYMHSGITWDGWEIGEDGAAVNPYEFSE